MNFSDLLKIYGYMNGLLVVGYLIFSVSKKFGMNSKFHLSFRQGIQVAQILIALSIATPVVFHQLPRKTFPQIEWTEFASIPEKASNNSSLGVQKVNRSIVVSEAIRKNAEAGFGSMLWNNKTNLLSAFLLLGFCFMLSRFTWNAWKINKLISSAVVIRKIGKMKMAFYSSI